MTAPFFLLLSNIVDTLLICLQVFAKVLWNFSPVLALFIVFFFVMRVVMR